MIAQALADTDWAAQDSLSDEEIARRVVADPDAAPILSDAETAAALVRTVRHRLGLSQAAFAARFHIPAGTLRDWEQSRKKPDTTAMAFLRVIAREPDMVARALDPVTR
ncbi:helix-turn-helix domain-containing protein [Roseomonas aerophila]|uniref:Helix-turn-helix domain-containing protein n=2 Tax=Teichococcus aerophilus TaxID=1224513 RepID=A0ABR7RT87_9PROT|nr:helix-turn-helix domain-containing protein [Pseudoroseomonas aerophila]